MNSNDYGEPVSPLRRAWENGGRQYYEERKRQAARQTSVIDYEGQMDVCTPTRHLYATSPGYTLREQAYLVRTGQLDGGLAAPAGWREPQPAAQPVRSRPQLAEWQPPAAVKPAPQPIVYAQYDPAFDPDLHPQPVCAAKPKPAKTVPAPQAAPTVQPDDNSDDGELPPGLTTTAWLAMRHLVSIARNAVADPTSVSYVPEESEEQPQLVVTPAGFRYTEKFNHLELR